MNRILFYTPIVACLLVVCSASGSLFGETKASTTSEHSAFLTGTAVQTLRPTNYTFDSPLLRITGVYGVSHKAFAENTRNSAVFAVSSTLLQGGEMTRNSSVVDRMAPYAYDRNKDTVKEFEQAQQKYYTALKSGPGDVPAGAKGEVEGSLPKELDIDQQEAFEGLNTSKAKSLRGYAAHFQKKECNRVPKCGEDDKECKSQPAADQKTDEDTDACGDYAEDESQQCTDKGSCEEVATSCDDYCQTEQPGLLATGGYGGGSGGGGGYAGFGGGGGSDGGGGGNTTTTTIIKVIVPEPASYLILASMIGIAVWSGAKRRPLGCHSSSKNR